jgi:hypothetical protein
MGGLPVRASQPFDLSLDDIERPDREEKRVKP